MSDKPTREHLQRVLQEAKASSAGGQADLDDLRRAAMLQKMVELQEKAKAMGLDHIAVNAQVAINEMKAAEDALRASLSAADEAHDLGLKILIQKRDDQD